MVQKVLQGEFCSFWLTALAAAAAAATTLHSMPDLHHYSSCSMQIQQASF
jgi:hypothetical protein